MRVAGEALDDEALQGKLPPHSVQAEQGVLGALLLDNSAMQQVSGVLRADHFYTLDHALIFGAIARLLHAGKPADLITVFQALADDGKADEAGGLAYLSQLMQGVATAGNIVAHADIVLARAMARALVQVGRDLVDAAMKGRSDRADVDQIIGASMLRLLDLQRRASHDEPRHIDVLLPVWMEDLEARAAGKSDAIVTGLHDLDRALGGGLRRGELMVLGARPSMGKSALCLTVARNVSERADVLVCSMEDSEQMLVSRHVAAAGRVNLAKIRLPDPNDDQLWGGVADGVERLRGLRMHIDDAPGLGLRDVRRKALQVAARGGDLQLVIVDYLQLMEGSGDNRHQQLGAIAAGLKRLAKELRCAVLLLSQLNREADKTDKPPRLDHLRESGGIEEAADIVALLWREARAKPRHDNKHDAQLELAKNKNGATDTVRLWFDGATQRFEDAVHGTD